MTDTMAHIAGRTMDVEDAAGTSSDAACLIETAPVPLVVLDADHRVAWANADARRLTINADALRPGAVTARIDATDFDLAWKRHGKGWLVALWDAGARTQAEDEARTDELTGLGNRAALMERLADDLHRADRAGADVTVLMLDLDRFKPVNDMLGHAVGDALLRAVAGRLESAVREGDGVYRLGGDEFVVLLGSAGSGDVREAADAIAARMVDLVGRAFLIEGQMASVGASVGVAVSEGSTDPADVLRRADLALYRAKGEGRGRVAWFEAGMDQAMRERRELEIDMRRGLGLEQFELYYQPQFDTVGACVTGFEALIRWSHPERGTISPADFIPLAEATGLIVPIGQWVLRSACAEAASWTAPLDVSVNVSPAQFASGDLVDVVTDALERSSLDPHRLVIEITEGVLLAEDADTLGILEGLRALGVRIAMDDFGTGCSSLSYLRAFPFDIVKVDQSFVRGTGDAERMSAIVRAVVSLSAQIGMSVTAEGVETMEQMEAIQRDGCGHAQGYLVGRPMPAATVGRFVGALTPDELPASVRRPTPRRPDAVPTPVAPAAEPAAEADPITVAPPPLAMPAPAAGTRAEAQLVEVDKVKKDDVAPAAGLHRLVYRSRSARYATEAARLADLDAILAVSRRNNERDGVTGALMLNGTDYVQVLEGTRGAVERTFERINLDPRHAEVLLLGFAPAETRLFGNWSMANVGEADAGSLAVRTGFDVAALEGDAMVERLHSLLSRDAVLV